MLQIINKNNRKELNAMQNKFYFLTIFLFLLINIVIYNVINYCLINFSEIFFIKTNQQLQFIINNISFLFNFGITTIISGLICLIGILVVHQNSFKKFKENSWYNPELNEKIMMQTKAGVILKTWEFLTGLSIGIILIAILVKTPI